MIWASVWASVGGVCASVCVWWEVCNLVSVPLSVWCIGPDVASVIELALHVGGQGSPTRCVGAATACVRA